MRSSTWSPSRFVGLMAGAIMCPHPVSMLALPIKHPVKSPASSIYGATRVTLATGKILSVSGSVVIKRPGWKTAVPATRNFPLVAGDTVEVGASSRTSALCLADWRTFAWAPGKHVFACSVPPSRAQDRFTAAYVRSRSVVRTHIVNGTPEEVGEGGSPQDWLARILSTRPATWPTSISLETLIKGTEHDDLAEKIDSMSISQDAKRLMLADLDAMSKLYEQASEYLKQISTAASDPLIQLMLGDLALAQGDPDDAKAHYQSASSIASRQRNYLGEAIAHHALGMIQLDEETPDDATKALAAAMRLYNTVGERETAKGIQRMLRTLHLRSTARERSASSACYRLSLAP